MGAAGPGWAGAGGWEAQAAGLLLSLSLSLKKIKKQNRDRKEKKEGLGEEVGHGDNFSGLAKMSLTQEKWSGQDCKVYI